jgi:hypothetical protein
LVHLLADCEISTLSRSDLYAVLEAFPQSAKLIQKAGLRIAFTRAMTVVSLYRRAKRLHRGTFHQVIRGFSQLPCGRTTLIFLSLALPGDYQRDKPGKPTHERGGEKKDTGTRTDSEADEADGTACKFYDDGEAGAWPTFPPRSRALQDELAFARARPLLCLARPQTPALIIFAGLLTCVLHSHRTQMPSDMLHDVLDLLEVTDESPWREPSYEAKAADEAEEEARRSMASEQAQLAALCVGTVVQHGCVRALVVHAADNK